MEKIVIIGANDFQNPLNLKAKEMGYETHVFAWREGAIGEKSADCFYPISIIEKDRILEECRKIKPAAVLTIASDLAVITSSYVARNLGLNTNSKKCIDMTTNKVKMRRALKEAGIYTPKFCEVNDDNCIEKSKGMIFPVIIKPTDRSGSRSITKVQKAEGISEAVSQAVKDSFEGKAIMEEYIEGDEYSLEAITFKGTHRFLAITRKQTTGPPHYIETGHIQPAGLTKEAEYPILEAIGNALDALDIQNGASHSEFRLDEKGNVRIIEIGARMGGDCIGSHLVPISTGYDFVKMVIQVGLNKQPDVSRLTKPQIAIIQFIMDKTDLEKLESIKTCYPLNLMYVSPMAAFTNHKVFDSSSRHGYYMIACDTMEQAKRIIKC